jgi:hypothetical protein
MCGGAAGMDYALRYALVVKMGDLLAQNKILQERRPAISSFERILIVGNWNALISGQRLAAGIDTDPVEWETAWIGPQLWLASAGLIGRIGFR